MKDRQFDNMIKVIKAYNERCKRVASFMFVINCIAYGLAIASIIAFLLRVIH